MYFQYTPTAVTIACSIALLSAIVTASASRFRNNSRAVYFACSIGMLFALALAAQIGSVLIFFLVIFTLIALFRLGLDLLRPRPIVHIPSAKPSRYVRLQQNGGAHTEAEWRALCAAFGHRCAACGRKRRLTKDHVTPVISGGMDNISNLQPLCRPCNSRKGTRAIDYRRKAR